MTGPCPLIDRDLLRAWPPGPPPGSRPGWVTRPDPQAPPSFGTGWGPVPF